MFRHLQCFELHRPNSDRLPKRNAPSPIVFMPANNPYSGLSVSAWNMPRHFLLWSSKQNSFYIPLEAWRNYGIFFPLFFPLLENSSRVRESRGDNLSNEVAIALHFFPPNFFLTQYNSFKVECWNLYICTNQAKLGPDLDYSFRFLIDFFAGFWFQWMGRFSFRSSICSFVRPPPS